MSRGAEFVYWMFYSGASYFGYTEREVKEVFTALYPRLCAYVNGVTGRADLADDIIQEIFYKFLKRRPCLDRDKVPAYLFSMAHNECLNWLRQNKILYNSIDLGKLQESRAWETLAMRDFLDAPNDSPLATLLVEEVLALCDHLHIAQRTVEKHISISIRWFRRSPQFKGYWPDSEQKND